MNSNLRSATACSLFLLWSACAVQEDEPVIPVAELWSRADQALLDDRKARALALADRAVKAEPSARGHVRRGMMRFQLAEVNPSIADFDRAVELEPALEPYIWQRGISQYYAGMFRQGREQFESHRKVNGDDVENSAWHFLCAARELSPAQAQARFLRIETSVDGTFPDRRVPMQQIYELFAGTGDEARVFEATVRHGGRARFYAQLYLGLHHEAFGRNQQAREHLDKAAELSEAGGYMGSVALVHVQRLSDENRRD